MKKLEQLKKLLSNPHISEDMKKKTKEAIEKLEGSGKLHVWGSDIPNKPRKKNPLTVFFEGYTKFENEVTEGIEDKGVSRGDAQGMVEAQESYVKSAYEDKVSVSSVVKFIWGDDDSLKAKKATRKGKGVKAILKDKPKDTGVPNCDELLDNLRKKKKSTKKYQKKIKANGGEPLGNDKECDCKELLDACVQIREIFRINHASAKEGGKNFFSKGFKIEFDILDKAIKNHK